MVGEAFNAGSMPEIEGAQMKKMLLVMAVVLLSGCASYSGRGLAPGSANLDDVLRTMGPPAMRWDHADGTKQLSYPRGPYSSESFMVNIGADGKLQSIHNTLQPVTMGRIKPGLTKEDVLRLLGPSEPSWTVYSPALNELAGTGAIWKTANPPTSSWYSTTRRGWCALP